MEKEQENPGLDGEIVEEAIEEAPEVVDMAALYLDKLKRTTADYENYRNRTIKEMGQMYDKGVRETIAAILPIIDNFALALSNADKDDGFVKGVVMIQSQLNVAMEGLGITKIPAMGEKFDIRLHAAAGHVKDEKYGENEIVEEMQAGYKHKDTVIRHAMVMVAN